MTSKEWEKYIRSLEKVSRPDDMELRLLADLAACEKESESCRTALIEIGEERAREWKRAEATEAALKHIRDDLSGYCSHEYPCLLAQWHEGRPTSDGGYKTRYGDQWYQRGDKPTCTCGLSDILEAIP